MTIPPIIVAIAAIFSASEVVRVPRDLLDAIRMVESGDQPNPPRGDGGMARGPYQIWRVYWEDSRIPGKYDDVDGKEYSERVMMAYWIRYCPKALKARDYETLARVHNGGPKGAGKNATKAYWLRVKKHLKGKP